MHLALRMKDLKFGADYHDLTTFYWEAGEWDKAVTVAREGLTRAEGALVELRAFLAERARESGDRQQHLELQFARATDRLLSGLACGRPSDP